MKNICDMNACTGCLACRDACRQKAIDTQENEQGFVYPKINESKCVDCGLCVSVCPVNNSNKYVKSEKVYASWNKDLPERRAATSGGVFTLIARKFVECDGVVYGAAFNDNMKVCHIRVDSNEQNAVNKLRGSKYVQSDTDGIFRKVEADLKKGKRVLFSGTGCQVSALKNFLRKEYSLLCCIDLVCHGVPSPMVYRDYLKWLESGNSSRIRTLSFRHKKPCWSVFSIKADFENGKTYMASKFRDPYLVFFLGEGDLTLRKSCFECRFTSPERSADITLADFWNYKAYKRRSKGVENGINLVLINSDKGEELFRAVKNDMVVEHKSWEDAHRTNKQLSESNKVPELYNSFWDDYIKGGFDVVLDKYYHFDKKMEKAALWACWKNAHMYLFPKKIIVLLRKLRESFNTY